MGEMVGRWDGYWVSEQQCLLLVVRLKLVLTPCIIWKEKIFFLKDKKEKDESYGRSEAELDTWTEYFLLLTAFLPTVSFDNHNDPVSQAGKQLLSLFDR